MSEALVIALRPPDGISRRVASLAALILMAQLTLADASQVLLHQRVDPFDITVFAPESQMTTAPTDLTVMIQTASDHSNVPDAQVTLRFDKNEAGRIVEVVAPATHAKATNKLLYGANVKLPSEGEWKFSADIDAQGKNVVLADKLDVGPPEPPLKEKWPIILFVPFAIFVFILNRRLKRRWLRTRPTARP